MTHIDMPGEFKFEVGCKPALHFEDDQRPHYFAQLPHSCGEWVIAWERDKAVAIAQTELFIAEAQAALAKLRGLRATGEEGTDASP